MKTNKITGTFVRSTETMKKYFDTMQERKKLQEQGIQTKNPFTDDLNIIQEFEHWIIIPNGFPYDAIADPSHMIFTKRDVAFDWSLLNEKEIQEFEDIRKTYIAEHYDVLWENLPSGQTIPGRFHLHLLKLKRYEI